jgi:hypothetical protein
MVGVEEGTITGIAGMKGHPVNNGEICVPASNIPSMFNAEGRLTLPLMRRGDKLEAAGWDEAIAYVSSKFNKIIKDHGPGAIAFYGQRQGARLSTSYRDSIPGIFVPCGSVIPTLPHPCLTRDGLKRDSPRPGYLSYRIYSILLKQRYWPM